MVINKISKRPATNFLFESLLLLRAVDGKEVAARGPHTDKTTGLSRRLQDRSMLHRPRRHGRLLDSDRARCGVFLFSITRYDYSDFHFRRLSNAPAATYRYQQLRRSYWLEKVSIINQPIDTYITFTQ